MKLLKKTYILLTTLLLFTSCKEEILSTFSSEDNGSSIYFLMPYSTANQTSPNTQSKYSFAFEKPEYKTHTFNIPVRVSGKPVNYDRKFNILIDPNSSMKEGVHFTINRELLIVKADSIQSYITIEVKRTADLQLEPLDLNIRLAKNEDFNINIRQQANINKTKYTSVLDYSIVVDDIFGAPYAWLHYSNRFEPNLGKYSREKFNLLLEIFDLDVDIFIDPNTPQETFSASTMSFWRSYFSFWLMTEKNEGRVYYDGNGDEITIP